MFDYSDAGSIPAISTIVNASQAIICEAFFLF